MKVDKNNLRHIVNTFLPDEINHLNESLPKDLPEDTKEAIKYIESDEAADVGSLDHIAYNLLKLKRELEEDRERNFGPVFQSVEEIVSLLEEIEATTSDQNTANKICEFLIKEGIWK